MRVLILGATGLLGQAMGHEARRRGHEVLTAARHDAPIRLDISDLEATGRALAESRPDLVINCAALTDIAGCEEDPGLAWRINARPLAMLAGWSQRTGNPLLQVSTDHFFPAGGDRPHDEDAPVTLLNEYARSKFAGEALALTAPGALVLRTSIVGIRGWERPSFAEWAIGVVLEDAPVSLFADAFTSSIDVAAMARGSFDLLAAGATGRLNLAAGAVYSKAAFIGEIARQLGRRLSHAKTGSVGALTPPRPQCCGLDVRRAEAVLGYTLPDLATVVAAILKQREERHRDDDL